MMKAEVDEAGVAGLEVRLAASTDEVEAAQRLRYRVFYDEMGAMPTPEMAAQGRDFDDFDDVCDHLLVIDRSKGNGASGVVGTYRLQRRDTQKFSRFYTASEYDISKIAAFPGHVLELGRSCVDPAFRTRMTMQSLWRGIAGYVFSHNIDLMFGCASLHGTDPAALAVPLSFLYHNHLAPDSIRPRALPGLYSEMNLLSPQEISARQAVVTLPPLVKGYLRLGGFVGDGAVVDHQFNTTDVCVIVKTDLITDKYFRHYDRTATRNL
ncbi:GNAT family N-acyltransferase [Telmatospirillum sp.]|uniref:GNAT family N-acetyltransferase n=1 Tax=Telmatospirillum sp. TaxID=2079197 RepID=UPI0028431169|nr:GNAT family N-acyltransferase [Telmatospirillum sp.]MDR3440418.1 GNAT family N-acetyltransferase [Telmatospirillum sp.]